MTLVSGVVLRYNGASEALIEKSNSAMSSPLWFVDLLKWLYPSRHVLARMTHFPLIGQVVDHFLFRDDEIIYLPKDHTVQIRADLEPPSSTVLPSQVVDHFICQAQHHWIMDTCICREGEGCQKYPVDLGCIFLGESVTKINPALGRFVTQEEALVHAQRCREAGLVHTIGRNRLDAVWLGAHPSEKLLTICNCCPCCCLWGLATDLTPDIGDKITKMSGVHVAVNGNCSGCELCLDGVCNMNAVEMVNGQVQISGACRGCGRCVEVCPDGAIELTIQDPQILQRTIEQITPLVDLS